MSFSSTAGPSFSPGGPKNPRSAPGFFRRTSWVPFTCLSWSFASAKPFWHWSLASVGPFFKVVSPCWRQTNLIHTKKIPKARFWMGRCVLFFFRRFFSMFELFSNGTFHLMFAFLKWELCWILDLLTVSCRFFPEPRSKCSVHAAVGEACKTCPGCWGLMWFLISHGNIELPLGITYRECWKCCFSWKICWASSEATPRYSKYKGILLSAMRWMTPHIPYAQLKPLFLHVPPVVKIFAQYFCVRKGGIPLNGSKWQF